MCDLTAQEKQILIKLLDLASNQGIIGVQGGIPGALKTYNMLNQIRIKLHPIVKTEKKIVKAKEGR